MGRRDKSSRIQQRDGRVSSSRRKDRAAGSICVASVARTRGAQRHRVVAQGCSDESDHTRSAVTSLQAIDADLCGVESADGAGRRLESYRPRAQSLNNSSDVTAARHVEHRCRDFDDLKSHRSVIDRVVYRLR